MFRKLNFAVIIVILFCQCVYALPHPEKGVQREYYTNGKIRLETVFKKGHVVRSRTFYENGKLQSEFRYKPGVLQKARTFYDNGVLRSEWTRKEGVMRFYSLTGALTDQSQLKDY